VDIRRVFIGKGFKNQKMRAILALADRTFGTRTWARDWA
jgi:hypothetical protein